MRILARIFLFIFSVSAVASEDELLSSYGTSLLSAQNQTEVQKLNVEYNLALSSYYKCRQEVKNNYYPINCFKLRDIALSQKWDMSFTSKEFLVYINQFCLNKATSLKEPIYKGSQMSPLCLKKVQQQKELNTYKKDFSW